MDQKDTSLLDQYFDNLLSPDERKAVEARVQNEPELAASFALRQEQADWLGREAGRRAMQAQTADLGTEFFGVQASTPAPMQVSWSRRWLAAAAAITLLAVAVWFLNRTETPAYAAYSQHAPLQLTQRGNVEATKLAAETAFNSGKYEEALPLIQQLRSQQPDQVVLALYEGICCLETGRNTEANTIFQSIANGNSALKGEGTWYLALNYWKNGDIERCKSTLRLLQPSDDRFEQAQQILSGL
jgi:predicted Zn-dependent protease